MFIDGEICYILKNDIDAIEDALAQNMNIPEKDYNMFFKPYLIKPVLLEIHNEYFDNKETKWSKLYANEIKARTHKNT